MTINEKILSEFKDYIKEIDVTELNKISDGLYHMHSFLYNLCYTKKNEFSVNSFPRKLKYIITDCALMVYDEKGKRKES